MYNRRTSLSADFFLFSFLILLAVMVLSSAFWLQVYNDQLKEKRNKLRDEAIRIDSVLTDSLAYITQYTGFIGEKIKQQNRSRDLQYIAALISDTSSIRPPEQNFYFTTTFDWVTPDKLLRASSQGGVLSKPFDMRDRDYLQRTPLYPWTLQLSPPRIGGLSKQWIVPAGMGIVDDKGNFLGSITLGFSLKGLEQRIKRMLGETDIKYLVLTQDLKLILNSNTDNANGPDPKFNLALGENESTLQNFADYFGEPISYQDVNYGYFQKLHNYPYIVLVGYDKNMPLVLFNEIVLSRGLMLFGIGCVLLVMLWTMRRRFIKPVTELVRSADRIRKGEKVVIPESPIHEIDLLGRELKKIAEYVQTEHRINLELSAKTSQLESATQEALAARDAAVQADRAKTEFLANISHELRTPMNAIVGLTNIMLMKRLSPERQAEYLKTMDMSAHQLLQLINDLLDIAKMDSDQLQLESIPFDIAAVVDEVIQVNALKAKEKNIELRSEMRALTDRMLLGDPNRLKQVLMNLVSNAIKFTHKGHVAVEVKCRPADAAELWNVEISVRDTGIGIPKNKMQVIFDKFSQADTSITRKYGGTGLGLTICKTLVQLMHGTLSVSSEQDEGSRFTVHLALPTVRQHALDDIVITPPPPLPEVIPANAMNVLLVEDNKDNILVMTSLLEAYGYRYGTARDGNEALDLLDRHHFDIVLMDIQMPEMDGFKTTSHVRTRESEKGGRRIPIIGMTACAMKGDRERCLAAGMDDYIAKPFNPDALFALLKRFCKNTPPPWDGKVTKTKISS